jgi:hypothetical protein
MDDPCYGSGSGGAAFSFNKIKQVFFIIANVKFFQQLQVFFPKSTFFVMNVLVQNVFADPVYMGMGVGKDTVPLLPFKSPVDPFLAVDEFIAFDLDLFDELGNQHAAGLKPDKQMGVVGHAMHREHFGLSVKHQSGHVFMEFLFVCFGNQAPAVTHGKDKLQINLRICVGHLVLQFARQVAPLEPELVAHLFSL